MIKIVTSISPDIVFTTFNRGPVFSTLVKLKKSFGFRFGKWNEPYIASSLLKRIQTPLRNFVLKKIWRKQLDFMLLIDDRAIKFYRNFVKKPQMVFRFPYYEDVPKTKIRKKKVPIGEKVCFLFSGRLAKEHNIKRMAMAFLRLYKKYPDKFEIIISAEGPEKKWLDRIQKKTGNCLKIRYDTKFDEWNDRLRPFTDSHVLLLPSSGSGWGLVINEALALGLPVISTDQVGASRAILDHMINGMIIKPKIREIYDALEYFILYPDDIERFSMNALAIKNTYSLSIGSERLLGIFQSILMQFKSSS